MEPRTEYRRRLRNTLDPSLVVEELEKEVEAAPEGAERSERLLQLGEACEEILPDRERALSLYQRAWKAARENVRALAMARAVYRELGKLDLVAKLWELELQVAPSGAGRAAVLLGLATTQIDLGNAVAARPLLEEAATLTPADPDVQATLAAARATADDWLPLAEKALVEGQKATGKEAARHFLQASRMLAVHAADDPMREEALRRALAAEPDSEEALYLLEAQLFATHRVDDLMKLHEACAAAATSTARRAAVYRRAATAWTYRFADRERGALFVRKALEAAYGDGEVTLPGHLAAMAFLREVLGEKGDWEKFVDLADRGLRARLATDDKIFVARAGAIVAWKKLEDVSRARPFFVELRTLDPESAELKEFVTATGAVLETQAAAVASEPVASGGAAATAAAALGEEAASVQKIETSAAPPPEPTAVVAPEAKAAPVATPEASAAVAAPPEAKAPAPVESEPAEILDDAVQPLVQAARNAEGVSVDKGIDGWRKVAQAAPDKATPRRELARLYRQAERWQPLVETLKELAEKSKTTGAKVAALTEAAHLYKERLKLDAMVVTTMSAIVGLDPGNLPALDALAGQYEGMKRWPDLISTLQKKALRVTVPADKAALHLRIAGLFQEKFSNTAEAIKAYEAALEIEPDNGTAIEFLKQNYEKRRDWEKLLAVKKREVERLADPAERTLRMVEIAKLASEKLKKAPVSIDLWSRVLASDPDHLEALGELKKLYEREKAWEELARTSEKLVGLAKDNPTRVAELGTLGLLYGDKLQSPERAVTAWRALLAVEPENRRAQDSLKKLYLQQRSWGELEAFYDAQGKIDEYVRVLERQVESEDDKTKLDLHGRIAALYRDKLGKADRAMRAFERVLALDGQNRDAAEALIPLYEGAKDTKKLVSALEIQLGHTTDRGARQERMRRLAELSEKVLKDKGAAYGWWLKMIAETPGDETLRPEIERLAGETGGFPELVAAYEKAASELPDASRALSLHLTVAKVYEEDLAEAEKAVATNVRILAIDPESQPAIAALERLYTRTERFTDLLQILERRLALTTRGGDEAAEKEIRYRLAGLYEDELKDPAHAIQRYRELLERFGDELPGLRALDRLYEAAGAHRELSDVIGRQLALVQGAVTPDPEALATLKFRLGRLREGPLGDLPGAIDCYRDLLELDPSHAGAREALERRLSEPEHQLVSAAILEPVYLQIEEWTALVRIHEIQLARKSPTDLAGRMDLLLRIAELWAEKAADGERAFEAYSRCFAVDPTVQKSRDELARLADLLEKHEDAIALYEAALTKEGALGTELQRDLCLRIASLYDEKLDQADPAIEFYRRAHALEPDDSRALEPLEKLFQRKEQWSDLVEVYRKKIELTQDAEARVRLYFQAAYVYEELLQNPDEAISTYREVLGQDHANTQALRALDKLYAAKGRWRELADNLTRQLALLGDDRAAEVPLLVRLADLRETRLTEVGAAIETYRQVLELERSNEPARHALERLIQLPDHELGVAQTLEPIYQAGGDWEKLVGVYEIMVRHALDPVQKIALLHQIGQLYEEAGDAPDRAFATYARALREDPAVAETQGRLDRLGGTLGKWEEVVALYEGVIAGVVDEELRVTLQMKLAHVLQDQIQDYPRAAEAFEKVFTFHGKSLEAADALLRLYEAEGNFAKLVDVLLRKADMLLDPDERKRLCFQAADLREGRIDDAEGAIGIYRHILELDENDTQALDNLERLYIQLSRWESLKDIYQKKAGLAQSPDERKKMLFVLGQVYDAELGDKARAIETYQSILELDPADYEAIQALDRLFTQTGRYYDLLQILEREVELAQATGDVVATKYRMGQLWELELKDLARAVESSREALALDALHEPTLRALEGLAHRDGEPVLAAQVLEPIYRSACEWERLVDLYEVMVRHADEPARRVDFLHVIAAIDERELAQGDAAFLAYARALKEDPQNETTLAALERLGGLLDQWAPLARLYEDELTRTVEPARQVELLLRLARVYEEELRQPDQAIAAFRRVLDVDGESREAILSLDRLYEGLERWRELGDVLRREIRLAASDADIVRLQFRLGQTCEIHLKDVRAAIDVYREILAVAPDHGPTLQSLELLFAEGVQQFEIAGILEPLYRIGERWENLYRVYDVQLARIEEPADRMAMHQRMAELAEQRLGDVSRSFAAWGRALGENPRSEQAIEELERLARLTGAWVDVVGVYQAALAAHDEPAIQRGLQLRLARVYDEEAHDRALAEETFLRVLAIDEKDETALTALDRIYDGAGMWAELAEILRRRIAGTTATEELVTLHFRLGRLYADALDEPAAAIRSYETILDSDSRNGGALEALERIYFRRQEWAKLYATYEKMIDLAPGDEALADCYAHMARLAQDALDDEEKALELWGRVVDLRGEDPIALEAMGDMHERRGEWRELVDILERTVRLVHEPAAQVPIQKRLGVIWAERLGRERSALEAWGRASELDPTDLDSLRAIAALHKRMQAWDDYGVALRRLIDVAVSRLPDGELLDLYAELGRLEAETLLRPQEAVDAWRQVLQIDAGSPAALDALEKIFTSEARWEECLEILERRSTLAEDPAARLELLLQVARTWEEKVGDLARASEVYERVLATEPSNLGASQAIERIAREQGNWEKVIEILLGRVEFLTEPVQRIELLHAVARTYEEELGSSELAFEVLRAAFKEDFTNNETAAALQRIASSSGRWNDLLGDYSQVVQTIQDPVVACDLWVKIANWYGEHLGHLDYAIASASQALGLDPNHSGALSALGQFYRKAQRWADLATTLAKHAEVERDAGRKVEVLLQLGEIQESQIQESHLAIGSYRQALEVDPASLDALGSLERNYRKLEMWEQLVDILRRKAKLIQDADEIIRLHLTVGDLYEHELNDPKGAVDSYRSVIAIDPRHLVALRALEQLYDRLGDGTGHVANLEQQLEAVESDDERIALLRRLAALYEEQFQQAERACEALEKILQYRDRDEGALRGLERLYATERKFDLLVDTLRRHINAVNEPTARIALYAHMGKVYAEEMKDLDRAVECHQDVLSIDPDQSEALHALGRLFEKLENWPRAIETMEREIQLTGDKPRRTELLFRIGQILLHEEDPEGAEERLVQALTIDPAHVPSMNTLTELYKQRGDWLKAGNLMVRAEAHAESSLEKVRLLFEAGTIFLERILDETRAADLLARTLQIDPEHQAAGEPLAEIYFKEQRWQELEPILDMLVRKADRRDGRELNVLYYRLAKTADELGNPDKALKYYKAAYDIDSTYLPTLLGRASLLYKQEDWDGAFKIYQTILVHHRDSQKDADIVDIFYRLGNIKLKLGERKKALNMFEKALEINAAHRPTLEAMIELQVQAGDFEAVVHAKRSLLPAASPAERFRILDEIGELYREKLQNPQKAIGEYHSALELQPDDHAVLHKILELYSETKQWKKAVEVLMRIAELEKDTLRRGKYYYTAAVINRDEVKAVDEAIEYFDRALNSYFELPELVTEATIPTYLKAFEAIDRVLTMKKDWKSLERAYRRMIKRLPADGFAAIKIALYHALGEIYRSRMRDWNSAMAAFEVASQMDPVNPGRHEILAELYVLAGPDYFQKAVAEHQTLIKGSPYRIESYRALRKIYMDSRQYDKAWCVCAALAFLKKADGEEQQFFEQYRPKGMPRARARLTDDLWNRSVLHAEQDRYIGAIFATIQSGVALQRSRQHKDFGLKRKDKHDIATSQVLFPKVFGYTLQVLGVPQPELYLRAEQPGEIAVAPTNEKGVFIQSIVAQANVLQGRKDVDLAYVCGRWLTLLRPEHFLKWIIPTNAELKMIFLIALRLVNPKIPIGGDPAVVQQFHQSIVQAIPPHLLEALSVVVNKFLATKAEADLSKWSTTVDLTAQRVGFILCGDLELAARLVSQEPVSVGGMQPKERIKELILYSISEEYFLVRQALGLAVA